MPKMRFVEDWIERVDAVQSCFWKAGTIADLTDAQIAKAGDCVEPAHKVDMSTPKAEAEAKAKSEAEAQAKAKAAKAAK
jgi:hypothetical protein